LLAQEKIVEEKPAAYTLIRIHPLTGQMYLLSKGAKEVSVYEGFQLVARVPIGNEAVSMEIDPLTGNVYVANAGDGTVSVIHDTQVLATIKTGWRPSAIGINPNNGWVYVSNVGDQTITVLGYPSPNYTRPAPTAPTRASTPRPYP
jgi:YVTN family beta-propeller protein